MPSRTEPVANVAIAVMCLAVTYALADRFILPRFYGTAAVTGYRSGDQLTESRGELGLEKSRVTAVVVVSSNCGYCRDSVRFYRQLVALTQGRAQGTLRLLFLGLRDAQDAVSFVTMNDLRPADASATPADVRARVPGTPTLLIVDQSGSVRGSWSGKLTAADETGILDFLAGTMAAN